MKYLLSALIPPESVVEPSRTIFILKLPACNDGLPSPGSSATTPLETVYVVPLGTPPNVASKFLPSTVFGNND